MDRIITSSRDRSSLLVHFHATCNTHIFLLSLRFLPQLPTASTVLFLLDTILTLVGMYEADVPDL